MHYPSMPLGAAEERGVKPIFEVKVRRENGDPDVMCLCLKCIGTVDDFLSVVGKKKVSRDGVCDRCG